jgi:hypothetical protein
MYRLFPAALISLVIACNSGTTNDPPPDKKQLDSSNTHIEKASPKLYANERFKDVTVSPVNADSFYVSGKAQVFEAAFSWVIEDGHEELNKGHEMTDAGAPEWGKFNFGIKAVKRTENSNLHLILFESSPKDGSRQYELMIPLE